MEKQYTTKVLHRKETHFFTVPINLIRIAKVGYRSPFQYVERDGELHLITFDGTIQQARERAKGYHDVVLLQSLGDGIQFKLNMPAWIWRRANFPQDALVKAVWRRDSHGLSARFQVIEKQRKSE